jgi:hypothetical protein
VAVPARKFKEPEVANYRTTPKYKSGTSERTLRHTPPEERDIERIYSKPLKPVDVRLDLTVVGDREFAKVRYPADEEWNILQHQKKTQSNRGTVKYRGGGSSYQPPSTQTDNGGNGGDSGNGNKPVKSESRVRSESKPKAESTKDTSPRGYKEKKSEERKDDSKKDDNKGEKSKKPPM